MSYNLDEANTRKQIANFSVDEWIEFRNRLSWLSTNNKLSERNEKILNELIIKRRSTAELAYLARHDKAFDWLRSNQNKPMSYRRIQQILCEYFPEFHIKTTHKKERKDQHIRTEQNKLRNVVITESSCCAQCGSKEKLEIHHMLPVLLGGDNDARNLVILCENCHQKTTNYFLNKLRKLKKDGIYNPSAKIATNS